MCFPIEVTLNMRENHPTKGLNNSLILHPNFAAEVCDKKKSRVDILGEEPNYLYFPKDTRIYEFGRPQLSLWAFGEADAYFQSRT